MRVRFRQITDLRLINILRKEGNRVLEYITVNDTLKHNAKAGILRAKLKDTQNAEDPFTVTIQYKNNPVSFKGDCYDDPEEFFPLITFLSENELILFLEDDDEIMYFHCPLLS